MGKIKEFLKSLVKPADAKKYRYMSAIISVLIFMFEAYLLYLPVSINLKNSNELYAETNNFSKQIYNLEDTYNVGISNLKNSDYYIELEDSVYILKSKVENEGILKYQYRYSKNDVEYFINIIFDVNMDLDKEVTNIYNKFIEKYPNENTEKVAYASMIIYKEINSDTSLDDLIEHYHNEDVENVKETINKMTYMDLYGLETTDTSYCILFLKNCFYTEITDELANGDTELRVQVNYEDINLNMNNVNSISDFTNIFALKISSSFIERDTLLYLGNCIIDTIVYTIVLAFIMYICLRRRGCFRTFKEFYNTIAISSIIPIIVSFTLSWFINSIGGTVYLGLVSIFSIYMTYRVVTIKDI